MLAGHPQRQRPLQRPHLPRPCRGHRVVPLHTVRRLPHAAAGPAIGGHDIGDVFHVGPVRIEVTPADHAWQNASPGASTRVFRDEDCCGFWLTTPDGTIWYSGGLTPHPRPPPDQTHPGRADLRLLRQRVALRARRRREDRQHLPSHSAPAPPLGVGGRPDFAPFNADPASLLDRVVNPERIHVLAPGEPFTLRDSRAGHGH